MFENYKEIETTRFLKLIRNVKFRVNSRYTNNSASVLVDFPNYLDYDSVQDGFDICTSEIKANVNENSNPESRVHYLERIAKLFIDARNEIFLDDSGDLPYWDKPQLTNEFLTENSSHFYRQGVSDILGSYRKIVVKVLSFIEDLMNQIKKSNEGSKASIANYNKLKWHGQAKELATIFYKLMFELKDTDSGKTYLEKDIANVATFMSENFIQKDDVSFSFSSSKTSLTPSKVDKRSNRGKSIEF